MTNLLSYLDNDFNVITGFLRNFTSFSFLFQNSFRHNKDSTKTSQIFFTQILLMLTSYTSTVQGSKSGS